MVRKEFNKRLRKSLKGLNKQEWQEVINYYDEMIDDRIESGKTEEQAMPDKNNTSLAKMPLFMRFFANSRMVYIQYYRPRLCNKSSKISAFLLHASLTACF